MVKASTVAVMTTAAVVAAAPPSATAVAATAAEAPAAWHFVPLLGYGTLQISSIKCPSPSRRKC